MPGPSRKLTFAEVVFWGFSNIHVTSGASARETHDFAPTVGWEVTGIQLPQKCLEFCWFIGVLDKLNCGLVLNLLEFELLELELQSHRCGYTG